MVLIQSDTDYVFGGFSEFGFKEINEYNKHEYIYDNDYFLFSIDYKRIYSAIKETELVNHMDENYGLNFLNSYAFMDYFMSRKDNVIWSSIYNSFNGFGNRYELNGGDKNFKCTDMEVFEIIV